ncbi:hypothetical protein SARC_05130 [Sphaeroforma arctica JP610]|uniref:Uncharacterized protein n=1 Tax=Sphaeroforma arctica JP610 TaxID=667725 RepID=A0A0L0G189_9EUKA|nr:hypothetical protein SARC_05130 [Sphaeroforma arctica JP610]KNC82579.1 hypothetical protein SARC_05130 [Sphaeroforma arctica JP610]|eukprot:XP_014156481.1 hypothetical protein SARC_05130 [Sphaeroforma arctica JP610]
MQTNIFLWFIGIQTLINREKDDVPGNSEIVKQLLLENRVLYNRQRHEAEALQLQQYMDLLATDPQHEQVRVRSHFPIVQVSEHSLEEFVPPF